MKNKKLVINLVVIWFLSLWLSACVAQSPLEAFLPSTPTPIPTITPTATPAITSTPMVFPTRTPIARTPPAVRVNANAELKVIQAAYDAVIKYFYKEVDSAKLAQKALESAATFVKVTPPTDVKWVSDASANWKLFQTAFQELVADYPLPNEDLAHEVVKAIASASGDLHTYYADRRRSDAIERMGRGDNSTVGFGAYFILYQDAYWLQRLTTGGPAQLAGMKIGDQLVEYDGKKVDASNFAQIAQAAENKAYNFNLKRAGLPIGLTIVAKRYTILTAEWRLVNNHIGFITLNAFQQDVAARLDEAIADLRKKGADSLIIDLRFNGGGYDFEKVAGRFIKDGTLLGKFINRRGISDVKVEAKDKTPPLTLPLVVLIDRNSASASEIFSLAVQDAKVGTLIGGKSVGAIGTVRFWPLGDGTMLGVTNSIYETANGRKLNGVGVTPDMLIERSTPDILAGRDPQLAAAINFLEDK